MIFYRMLALMGVESVRNHTDFRLMSQKVLHAFKDFKEVNLYLRGVMPLIGFQQTTVRYDVAERFAGVSKYNFHKMLSFACARHCCPKRYSPNFHIVGLVLS